MSSVNQQQSLRSIYDLLDKLCRKFSPDHHKEILKTVTATIADLHQGFLSNLTFDESLIVTKIKNHLSSKSDANLSVFLQLHDELVTLSNPKFRSSILTLLLLLSDMNSKLPNTNKHLSESVFTLPVRNRSSEYSSSMEQIYRGMSSRVSAKYPINTTWRIICDVFFQNVSTSSLNSDHLKLVSYRRNIPSSSSSESVLNGQTPDSEASPFNYSQNEELVQEAIYALTGKSGKYLKKDVTGEFKPDIKSRNLNAQEVGKLLRLAEIGRLHNDIQKYTDSNREFFLCGLFGQGLISQLEIELVQFYGLVAHIQDNVWIFNVTVGDYIYTIFSLNSFIPKELNRIPMKQRIRSHY